MGADLCYDKCIIGGLDECWFICFSAVYIAVLSANCSEKFAKIVHETDQLSAAERTENRKTKHFPLIYRKERIISL